MTTRESIRQNLTLVQHHQEPQRLTGGQGVCGAASQGHGSVRVTIRGQRPNCTVHERVLGAEQGEGHS
jgi:hypothetical protein